MFGVTGLQLQQIKNASQTTEIKRVVNLDYFRWVTNWISGHILGGAVFYGFLGWIGSFLSPSAKYYCFLILAVFCVVAFIHQFGYIVLPMPQLTRQVAREWINKLHKNFVAFGYGFQLGTGVLTRIKIITIYFLIAFAFISGSIWGGVIIGVLFGFARAILPIIYASQNGQPHNSLGFSLKFNSYNNLIQRLNGIFLLLAGVIIFLVQFYY